MVAILHVSTPMKSNAYLTAIEYELPIRVLDNQHLAAEYPDWTADKIYAKTGIRERHIVSSTDIAYRFNWKYTYNQRPLLEWSRYFSFRLKAVPDIFSKLLETAHVSVNDIVSFVFHQAN